MMTNFDGKFCAKDFGPRKGIETTSHAISSPGALQKAFEMI